MATALDVPLAKVTVKAPKRWIDVALPADVPVAELLPYVLRHAGEDTADTGERHAGWLLRRQVGDRLDLQRTLAAQQVFDGELLHLVPGEVEWPELEYEDVVETIASGARRHGGSWPSAATRLCGLVLATLVLLAGALVTLRFEPPWLVPGLVLFAVATVLLAIGVLVARGVPDVAAGAVFAGCSLPYACLGGLLVTAPDHAGLTSLGSGQLLLAMVAVLGYGVAGFVGVAAWSRVFSAAVAVAVLGMLGALVGNTLSAAGAAAVVLVGGIGLLPGYPLLAIRLGRLPLPKLPQRSADLFTSEPPPAAPDVFQAAARTDEILTGLLAGLAVVSVVAAGFLVAAGGTAHQLLVGATGLALLLRARLFPVPRHRVSLLAAGMLAVAALVGLRVAGAAEPGGLALMLVTVVGAGCLVAAVGLVYSRTQPSPYLGRAGDVLDVVAVLALVPLAGFVTGMFGYVRSLLAGLG